LGAPKASLMHEQGDKLQKIMAAAGVGSRRHCEELIEGGHVRVNGRIAKIGDRAEAGARIVVDGVPLKHAEPPLCIMLHKPRGFITTASDPQGRPTVLDLIKTIKLRLFPVGRLDFDTSGLLLLTNDGALANTLTHPRYEVTRTYEAWVEGCPSDDALAALRHGVRLEDGVTAPAEVRLVKPGSLQSKLHLTIREGKKHQVKRMCEAVGYPVRRLHRIRLGPLELGNLAEGAWRKLTQAELSALRRAARGNPSVNTSAKKARVRSLDRGRTVE
jgi:23S rRNA pseudouridine2605 synthase